MRGDQPREQAPERPAAGDAAQPADQLRRSVRQPQIEALEAVLRWDERGGFPSATLAALRSVVVEFARDPAAPDLELVMRSARARAVCQARHAPHRGRLGGNLLRRNCLTFA